LHFVTIPTDLLGKRFAVSCCCRLASKQELLDNAHATLSQLHERFSAVTQVWDPFSAPP